MKVADTRSPGEARALSRLILSQKPIPVHVRVGQARLTATAHATRSTRFGEQVLVALSGRLTWVSVHRIEEEVFPFDERQAQHSLHLVGNQPP